MSFSEPSHPLLDVARLLERATDELVVALDLDAEAENAFLRVHSVAYLSADVAATVRGKWADAQPDVVTARCAWNLTAARSKACRAKCSELEARLGSSQSYFRLVGNQT